MTKSDAATCILHAQSGCIGLLRHFVPHNDRRAKVIAKRCLLRTQPSCYKMLQELDNLKW
ncbi:MAG: hypothetical protein AB1444_02105 [Spirochaetota bacterium]